MQYRDCRLHQDDRNIRRNDFLSSLSGRCSIVSNRGASGASVLSRVGVPVVKIWIWLVRRG
jgi:hypothetical protein